MDLCIDTTIRRLILPLPPKTADNPLWPLPKDYEKLPPELKKDARIQAVSSWWDPAQPKNIIADPEAFIIGFRFFKEYYRKGWEGNRQKYILKSPPMHDKWIRDIAYHRHILITGYRSSGKTFVVGEELPEFLILTRPHTPVTYTSAADDLTNKQVRAVRMDLLTNKRIVDDFGIQKPQIGSGKVWAKEQIELRNGSSMTAISAEQRQRGITSLSLRPYFQILDDWEVDKRLRNPELRADAEDWLFEVFFPCAVPWAWRIWTNTLLSIRSWSMQFSEGTEKRSKHWHISRYDMLYYDDGGNLCSSWPDYISVADALASASVGTAGIIGYGQKVFSKEFMNDPTARTDGAFDFDPDKHGFYWISKDGKRTIKECSTDKEIDYEDFEGKSFGVVGVDLALGTVGGDYSAIVATRLDRSGVLWCLEEYAAREKPVDVLYEALRMAEFWNADILAIERVAFEQIAIDLLQSEIDHRRLEGRYTPEINVVKRGGGEKKEIRILGLQYRFRTDTIKIALKGTYPARFGQGMPGLEEQIIHFSGDSRRSLRYDDLLDALVCCQDTLKHLGVQPESTKRDDPLAELRDQRSLGVSPCGAGTLPVDALRRERLKDLNQPERDVDLDEINSAVMGDVSEWSEGFLQSEWTDGW